MASPSVEHLISPSTMPISAGYGFGGSGVATVSTIAATALLCVTVNDNVFGAGQGDVNSVTDSTGLTWTKLFDYTNNGLDGGMHMTVWWAYAPTALTNITVFVTSAGSVDSVGFAVFGIINPNLTTIFDANGGALPSISITPDPVAVTYSTAVGNDLVLAILGGIEAAGTLPAAPSGFSVEATANGSAGARNVELNISSLLASGVISGATVTTNMGTATSIASAIAAIIALQPAVSLATVPDVVGDDDATAQAAILAASCTVGTITTAVDPSAAGTVLSQSPAGGTSVAIGSPVNLVESAGPATTVPDVVGLLDAAAQAAIVAAALTVGSITTANDPSPAGTVLSQSPAAGAGATFGDPVDLVESLGPPTGTVPDVTGLTAVTGSAVIVAAGFTVGVINAIYSNTVPAGIAISQAPAGGTTAALGSPVAFTLSNGPEPLTVPNVIGMTDAEAASLLTSLLLKHTVTFGFNTVVPAGIIYSQAPTAGEPIAQGGTVSYIVSLGPPVPLLITPFDVEQTVISQYANSPTLLQLIENMNTYIDPATNFENFFNNIWNIDTADTYGLNIWGRILGVSRVIPIPGDNDSFGFDNSDMPPDWQTWGNASDPAAGGPFFAGQLSTGSYTLDDPAYRTLLLAKALANIASMSAPSLNQLVSNLFPGRGRAYTTNGRNMTMTYVFDFALSTIELAILQSSGVLPNPAGVTVGITVSS